MWNRKVWRALTPCKFLGPLISQLHNNLTVSQKIHLDLWWSFVICRITIYICFSVISDFYKRMSFKIHFNLCFYCSTEKVYSFSFCTLSQEVKDLNLFFFCASLEKQPYPHESCTFSWNLNIFLYSRGYSSS